MKKIVLTIVAMMTMTLAFAEGENLNAENAVNAYEMNFSINSMSNALKLSDDQAEAVKDINKMFAVEMMNASVADKSDRKAMVAKAVKKNLGYMHYVLSDKQYHKYLLLLNATMNNRGLN